ARKAMAAYEDMAELIRLGAYKLGTNAEVDAAIELHPKLEAFLSQSKDEHTSLEAGYAGLGSIVGEGVMGENL
ncbi:MAG: flagellum-specific ATP synthase FliI, partial [Alphaproteobacteria bacterium]|nr:flagellum-specific ATP synthase FliI [Alphaproteobacteria bacterium]